MTVTQADDPAPASTHPPHSEPRGNLALFLRSPGVKFIMIGIISVALLVPLLLVWGLTEERAQRAADVSRRIANGWGGDQALNGPYLAVPFDVQRSREVDGRTVVEQVTEWALVMPETLDVAADLKTEERRLSIYTLPVYSGALTLKGFAAPGRLNVSDCACRNILCKPNGLSFASRSRSPYLSSPAIGCPACAACTLI